MIDVGVISAFGNACGTLQVSGKTLRPTPALFLFRTQQFRVGTDELSTTPANGLCRSLTEIALCLDPDEQDESPA